MALFACNPRMVDDFELLPFGGDELVRPFFDPRDLSALRSASNLAQQLQAWRDTQAEVQNTDEEFRIRLNLGKCFKPDEIKITTNDKQICIHAKHEERKDKHGSVYREMTRKYTLPPDVDPKDVSSTMNKEGVMFIKAGKKKEALEAPKEVPIRVEYKGC